MISKILSSVVGVGLILLLAFAPIWVAEKFETLETASEEIISNEEIHQSNSTYRPYLDLNNTTLMKGSLDIDTDGIFYYGSGSWLYIDDDVIWDASGYLDVVPMDDTRNSLYIYFWGDASELIVTGINTLRIEMVSDVPYSIDRMEWIGWDSDWEQTGYEGLWGFDSTEYNGSHAYNYEIDPSLMNDGVTIQSGSTHQGIMVRIDFVNPSWTDLIYFTLQWEPNYYVESSSILSSVSFVPFTQEISNSYNWHKWGLGVGGVVLIGLAIISTPQINFRRIKKK
jgi:hypothetical protein